MVQFEKLVRATVCVNNENNTDRVYTISAEAQIGENKEVLSISSGSVKRDDVSIASFYHNITDTSMSYIGLTNEEQIDVHNSVNAFIGEIKAYILTNTLSL